ncbi:retrovirus-related pol polyprotein from transposon TNT 1-94 [Tanacetum coccineum]
MDVKTTFLNEPLKEEVCVSQPKGFIDPDFSDHVYRLKKALYGLKQAPRAWYDKLSSFLIKYGFTKGGLMYLTASRPDIAYATFVCARYQARPTVKHLKEVKRIFRCLRQSYNMGLWYPKDSGFKLIAYSDADHAGCKDDCKSTSGGLQFLRAKLVIIWMRTQLLDYEYKYNQIPMYCDSKSAIAISCNPVQHSKTKHVDIRYHFIKEHVEKVIIMTQQQHAAYVHPDESCPPNKRYDLMDANKKVDLEHFWHTLKEDGSKHRLKFLLDRKELTLTLICLADVMKDILQRRKQEPRIWDADTSMDESQMRWKLKVRARSDKKSLEWSIVAGKEEETTSMVDVTNIVPPVNVDDEEDEITDEVFELRRRVKGKNVEETRISPIPSPTRSPRNLSTLVSSDTEKLQELTVTHPTPSSGSSEPKLTKTNHLLSLIKAKPNRFKRYKSFFHELQGRYGYLFAHLKKRFMPRTSSDQLADNLHDVMMETLPSLVKEKVTEQVKKEVPAQFVISSCVSCGKNNNINLYLAIKVDPYETQDIAIWLGGSPDEVEKTQSHRLNKFNVEKPVPSTSGIQNKMMEFVFLAAFYASDDDEIPTKQVTQDIMEEISLTIDEAKLKKMADEMLRQRCTSGDEHQYHIDQMKNFLQSDIVWESRKEILVSPHPRKITPLVQSCPEKIVLSLHKFPAIVFNDDDIEERTSRWVNKRQKEPRRPKEEIYSNSKIVQVIKTYWELGHEHKFITEIVARRANDCIVSITEPDYKNLNKNDIEDMYLLIVNNKVPDYANTGLLWSLSVFIRSSVIWERVHDFQLGIESYQQKINLTAPTITFPGIEEYDVFSIKFCDATLRRTLKGLKSYYNDVKYGYVQKELTNDKVEFLKLFEEEIEVRLNYRDQMRRWEMYVNGRPLGPRRERPE